MKREVNQLSKINTKFPKSLSLKLTLNEWRIRLNYERTKEKKMKKKMKNNL